MSTESTAALAPPGAGLPPLELALSRVMFLFGATVLSDRKASALFNKEAQEILALVESVSSDAAARPVLIKRLPGIEDSSRNWSLLMVLEHLCIVNAGCLSVVRHLNRQEEYGVEVRIEDVKPSPSANRAVVEKFRHEAEDYLAEIEREFPLSRDTKHAHPWFGPLTAHDWHCLAAVHHQIHRRQIQEILERL